MSYTFHFHCYLQHFWHFFLICCRTCNEGEATTVGQSDVNGSKNGNVSFETQRTHFKTIFQKRCFSFVKTLCWRIRLHRINVRILIFGGGIVPCFLLNFQVFWHVFRHIFSHRFFNSFFTKNMSKLTPKLSAWDPPFSTFFEVAIFCGIFVDCSSGRPPTPWDPGCWSDYFYTRNWWTLA